MQKIELKETSANEQSPEEIHCPHDGWSNGLIGRHPDKTSGDHKD
jgi:hypothetical protein